MLEAYLAYRARLQPRAPALILPGSRTTYAQLDADVNRYARGLAELGVRPESGFVAVEASTRYRYFAIMLALERLAVAITPPRDRRADLRISQTTSTRDPEARRLRLDAELTARIEAGPAEPFPAAARDPEAIGRVQMSSGSTRDARRIGRSWRVLQGRIHEAALLYGAGRAGTWIIRTGVDTGLGQALAGAAWATGSAVASDFVAEGLPAVIERAGAGVIGLTPLQLRELLAALPAGFAVQPDLRMLVAGGPLSPATAREARLRLTPDVSVVYGSSETGRVAAGPASRLETTPGWVGWPVPSARVQVVGPDDRILPPGELGEVRVAGEGSAQSYLDGPDARVFRGGWVYPGDLGRLTADGGLALEGRIDDVLNVGGLKVSPDRIEDAALEHPAVRDCAAFTLPDATGMNQVWLAVVAVGELTREGLYQHLKDRRVRLPTVHFAWTAAIPRSEMGKVDRAALRAQTLKALGREPA